MLTFYYHPLSPIARRVWLALLEKQLPFEAVLVNLATGEQKQPDYLALNPFHHVPTLVDGDLAVIESLAILDYLEAHYPTPSLMPSTSQAIAQMRMVQQVSVNEIVPKFAVLAAAETPDEALVQHLEKVLSFLSQQLGSGDYFGGSRLNLADIVAGASVPLICRLGISLESQPAIAAWRQRLAEREAWQKTEPGEPEFLQWRRYIQLMVKRKLKSA
ncbi:MAG: glutathione S-transferase family protein [Leptolyngbyaceae cyanobacterium SL_7_1]|nr:glutathione S-transferase family protein [Leptolyngbyaceae cyanobacterium SL_7_1]